jgi:tetratricopeptide (TPR) repeat protein
MFLGRIELQTGNPGHARAAFEAAKAADPTALDADWSLIDLDTVERKLNSARSRIAPLLEGPTEATARAKLALVEADAGRYEAASQQYKRVLLLRPSDAGVLNNLAYMLTEYMEKPAEALPYAQTAKALQPADASVDDTLGWTYYRLGRYVDAVRHLELAVKRTPSARRQAHLAMAYARYGDGARARQTLQAALKMDPALPEASIAQKMVAGGTP